MNDEFSAAHLAYFCFNRAGDPLGNIDGDKNLITSNYASNGGNPILGAFSLATWTGYADEAAFPFEEYTYEDYVGGKLIGLGRSVPDEYAYQDSVTIREMDRVTNPEDMKKFIRENGAVIACLYYKSSYIDYSGGSFAYYSGGPATANHAVTIVGWDDDYFDKIDGAKAFYENNDGIQSKGAWIVQNSWGEEWGDNGYFYVSYDEPLTNLVSVTVQDADKYDKNYQYDGTSSMRYSTIKKGQSLANVYTVDENDESAFEVLTGVAFSTYDSVDNDYNIAIYTNLKDKAKPTSGELVCSMDSVEVGKAGYHAVDLPNKVILKGGSSYSVVITANRTSYIGAEGDSDYSWLKCKAELAKGQSFAYMDGSWVDMYNYDCCNRIKAYTKGVAKVALSETEFEYDGTSHKPDVNIILDGGQILAEGEDFTVSYGENKLPGAGTVKIEGQGDYAGSITLGIEIKEESLALRETEKATTKLSLEWDQVPDVGYMIYRAKGTTGKFSKVKTFSKSTSTSWTNSKLSAGTTYRYKIRTYTKVGKKYYYGPYSEELYTTTKPYKSVMNKPTTGTSHYVKFSWKKKTGSGYELKVADNADFENAEVYTIESSKTLSKKLLEKEKGVKYYAKVRAYKNCKGEKIYGLYSTVKSIKCK